MVKAGIVGATGYTGVELLRLLSGHPEIEVSMVTSRSEAGKQISELFPSLRQHLDLTFSNVDVNTLAECDVVLFATPNGTAMQLVPELLQKNIKIIDLAADFRLKDAQLWEQWYRTPHACPEILQDAVYGMPEINRQAIRSAQLVANPGCYPTAVILGFLPLIEKGIVDLDSLIADAKSGVSGAGRKTQMNTQFCECGENFQAYSVPGHRHLPEIKQALHQISSGDVDLVFTPHLIPMVRGILATLYARLNDDTPAIQQLYETRYRDEPFVDVLPYESHPQTRDVQGANVCQVAVHRPQHGSTVVVLSVIDNLVKGAAGQAVQNVNLMFGFDETCGLEYAPLTP